ncbi:MAG: dihydrodipicolinate reductase [Paracoccaceae bacterium]
MRRMVAAMLVACFGGLATPVLADMPPITDRGQFLDLIKERTLTYPLVKLRVTADGKITGKGMLRDVTGDWAWQDGYFCREMDWSGRTIPYNCQEVRSDGRRMRFTSDRGEGDTAVFRLR